MSRNHHHANLLIGSRERAEAYLKVFCGSREIRLRNNPDYFVYQMEVFGIDEARELRLLAGRKAFVHEKIFLIVPGRVTLEAQNALLKTFEDPFPDTYFFLALREEFLIIPTLRSRMNMVPISRDLSHGSGEAEGFLSKSIKKRLLFAKSFVDEEKSLPVFLDDLLFQLRAQGDRERSIESVYNIRRLILDFSVASRLVIEHLSLVL